MFTRKDADGNKAIVEVSSTWAILAAKRISADNQESRRRWSRVREIRGDAYTVSGQEWRKCDHGGRLCPSRPDYLGGSRAREGGREGASLRLTKDKNRRRSIRNSMSASMEHTRQQTCFSDPENGNGNGT